MSDSSSSSSPDPNLDIKPLIAGVTTLFTAVGGLTATGVLGRLERNEPDALIAALVLVLLGGAMLVLAGLPVTSGHSQLFATLLGAGLTVIAIGWAFGAGVEDAGHSGRPRLRASVDAKGTVKGRVEAGNLASERRLAVLVEGLKPADDGGWEVNTLAQYYVGPDGEGKVSLPVNTVVPQGKDYTAVGIKAASDDTTSCSKYPRRTKNSEFKDQIDGVDAGCVVLPLASGEPAGTQAASASSVKARVRLAWLGHRAVPRRLRVDVVVPGPGKRAVVLVAARRGDGSVRQLSRSLAPLGKSGAYRSSSTIRVEPGFQLVCARADVVAESARPPARLRRCPLPRALRIGRAGNGTDGAQLRLPR